MLKTYISIPLSVRNQVFSLNEVHLDPAHSHMQFDAYEILHQITDKRAREDVHHNVVIFVALLTYLIYHTHFISFALWYVNRQLTKTL